MAGYFSRILKDNRARSKRSRVSRARAGLFAGRWAARLACATRLSWNSNSTRDLSAPPVSTCCCAAPAARTRPRLHAPMDAVLIVDKPAGITSAEAVRQIKGRVRPDRVGHLGT